VELLMIKSVPLASLLGEVAQEPVLVEACRLSPDHHHSIPYPIPCR